MNKVLTAYSCATLALLFGGQAIAGETLKHDLKVEQAAAIRAAARIGDLRGGQTHDADIAELIMLRNKKLPRPMLANPSEVSLPPMVMNEAVPEGVDMIITGSNKK